MLSHKEQLVEVIRVLEEEDYAFKNDPLPITESLKASQQDIQERIFSRASRIDAGQSIFNQIIQVHSRLKFIVIIIALLWVVLGFLGLFALMQSSSVNFFYILVSLLGMHTLMLALWAFFLIKGLFLKQQPHLWLFTPKFFMRRTDAITKAVMDVYTNQLQQNGMRWFVGKINHQLWLATLLGMLSAVIFLLMVKQYQFNWQSTLLTSETLTQIISAISWLPSQLGFSVPSTDDVVMSQTLSNNQQILDSALARKWAGLLIGSIITYGFIPRILAWIVCWVMLQKQQFNLPLHLPYYQNIIRGWSISVVDADDMPEKPIVKAKKAEISKDASVHNIACLLDTVTAPADWKDDVLGVVWQDCNQNNGIIDDRENLKTLLAFLEKNDCQLLVGIRLEALPDRGMLRKLTKLADACPSGIAIKLIGSSAHYDARYSQWHQALAEHNISLVQS